MKPRLWQHADTMTEELISRSALDWQDILAVIWLFAAWIGIGWYIEHPPKDRPSVSVLMRSYRREWMRQFTTRQPRIFDSAILQTLREGTSFFASACMIAIGGGLALLGNTERLRGIVGQFDIAPMPELQWELKIVVPLLLLVDAFLKFVWSHRLFGYCAILMAAVPNDHGDRLAAPRAQQAADVNITAARSFNAGLRSVYFAIGALGWLAGPWVLLATTTAVLLVTWRREFASKSRRAIQRSLPAPLSEEELFR